MGLAELQRVLAPLYTDSELRQQFLADPIALGLRMGLTAAEAQQLAAIAPKQLNFFAQSLQHKRQQEVAKMLSATARALAKDFTPLFTNFANQYLPQGNKKHYYDALAFCDYLQKAQPGMTEGMVPDWIKELARYESARLRSSSQKFILEFFRYPIDQLARSLLTDAVNNEQPLLPKRRITLVLWWRMTFAGRLYQRVFYGI